MSENQVLFDDGFWKFLVSLEELTEKKDKLLFCSSLGIDEQTLVVYQKFINRIDEVCVFDDLFIYPIENKNKIKVKLEFSFSEWLALQASIHAQALRGEKSYFHHIVENKLAFARKAHEQYDLFKKPAEIITLTGDLENLKKRLDHAICYRKSVEIHFLNQKSCKAFPQRLVYLDGVLCVIGESLQDRTLLYFGLEDIESVHDIEIEYEPQMSQLEINDFIAHLRLINGKEERLILKIYNQYETDLLPSYHYLENPFVTSNQDGDMIWAATIEICDDVFSWLYSMKDRVEVLDPGHVRKEFALYCEMKKNQNYGKKAS